MNLSRLSELSAATVFTSRMTKHLRLNVLCAGSLSQNIDILNVEKSEMFHFSPLVRQRRTFMQSGIQQAALVTRWAAVPPNY